jgi:hypothetical protein
LPEDLAGKCKSLAPTAADTVATQAAKKKAASDAPAAATGVDPGAADESHDADVAAVRAALGWLSALSVFLWKSHSVWGFCLGAQGA